MLFGNNTTNSAIAEVMANGGVDPNQQQVDQSQPMPAQNINFLDEMTKPAKPRLNKFANFLMGFGQGYQGKGQEFLANQRVLSKERKAAAAKDLFAVQQMMQNRILEAKGKGFKENSQEFKNFVGMPAVNFFENNRKPQIARLGGSSNETDALTDLVRADPIAALKSITEDLNIARANGFLPQPEYVFEDGNWYVKPSYGPP